MALLMFPLSWYLVYLQADARNASSCATGHVLAGNNLEKLRTSFGESRKICPDSLSKGGTLLPKNVDGFDEFEIVLRRAWEIQNSGPQRAERKLIEAIDVLWQQSPSLG